MAKLYILICSTSTTPDTLPYKVLGASTTHSLTLTGMVHNKMPIGYTGRIMEVFSVDGTNVKLDYRPNSRLPEGVRTVLVLNVFRDKQTASERLKEFAQAEENGNADFEGEWIYEVDEDGGPLMAVGCRNKIGVEDRVVLRFDVVEEEDEPPLFAGGGRSKIR
ncbi:hypothetical protein BDV96DRAFT_648798 [Lophiotrema nucula]|uniref:Uncharacterized protein n=1 Tax=Lophiotrema nucula TaxID=690887 RepID=A0A6A5Z2J2_9PLEO|nr:hypothetical protein BDV96DRAFT_648798 [Lophiotrema nucula]